MNKENFISVGRIHAAHGLSGELKLRLSTDFPERLCAPKQIYLVDEDCVRGPLQLISVRLRGEQALIELEDIESRESAQALCGLELAVPKDELPELLDGHYYYFQLIGLAVYTDQDEYLGRLTQVLPFPANDVYVVQQDDGCEILLPATKEVVLSIDLSAGTMLVHLLPGLC